MSRLTAEQGRVSVATMHAQPRPAPCSCKPCDVLHTFGLVQASAMAASVREAARVLADFVEKVFQSGLHVSGNPKVTAAVSAIPQSPVPEPHPHTHGGSGTGHGRIERQQTALDIVLAVHHTHAGVPCTHAARWLL